MAAAKRRKPAESKLDVVYLPIEKVKPYPNNPRNNQSAIEKVVRSIKEFGWRQPIVVDAKNVIIAGHTRLYAAQSLGLDQVPVHVARGLTPAQVRAYRIADNRVGQEATWDESKLLEELSALVGDIDMSVLGFDSSELDELLRTNVEGLTDADDVPEVSSSDAVSRVGDVWIMGRHRLMCGDSTSGESFLRLMSDQKAALVHADPPYGMGKEKDGVENDNLYNEKLDRFQMSWWSALRSYLCDNASAYIWGNAEDLWRLWYVGGLRDSERLTFRNEIVWSKGGGGFGVGAESQRMFFPEERCLFFFLGEQGFNSNADNYWEGWEPIRKYLEEERIKAGWDVPAMKRAVGHSDLSRDHWTSKSQWSFPSREVYEKLQKAANKKAFKRDYEIFKRDYEIVRRDYDDLKREFYATRAYFNNTHDNMTDVWSFNRVMGEDRHGHATPKPVEMVERIMLSSLPVNGLAVEPFIGSGTTIIAAEKTGRVCYGMEISPQYIDVSVKRWQNFTGKQASRESDGALFDDLLEAERPKRSRRRVA